MAFRHPTLLMKLVILVSSTLLVISVSAQHEDSHGHSSEGMSHDFSDAEHWSSIFDDQERDSWQKPKEVVAIMEVERKMTVVDLGAGTGYFLPHLAVAVGPEGKVLALEPEVNLVDFMRERAQKSRLDNVSVRQISVNDPELIPRSVDRILIVNTWHHISHRPDYARKLARALNPGGTIFVVDFDKDSPSGPPPRHRLPPERVVEELEAGGLEANIVEEDLPRQYIVSARTP